MSHSIWGAHAAVLNTNRGCVRLDTSLCWIPTLWMAWYLSQICWQVSPSSKACGPEHRAGERQSAWQGLLAVGSTHSKRCQKGGVATQTTLLCS